jgi:hypothetical protein
MAAGAFAGSPFPASSEQSVLIDSEVIFAVAVACAVPTPDLEVTMGLGPSVEASHSPLVPARTGAPRRAAATNEAA